jgi:RNA polymerase-associated protein
MVLAEKSINHETIDVIGDKVPEDLIDLNPYQSVPTLADRDLVLYGSQVIMEYLDERFPHPPLMPVDPVSRASVRLSMHRVECDWYDLADLIEHGTPKKAEKARKELKDSVLASDAIFAEKPFFLSDEMTLADCCVTPVLWRLQRYGIEIPARSRHLKAYCDRMFQRPSFRESLTTQESEMR